MTVYKMCLCYDGSPFNGWQKQENTGNTIQAVLEEALCRITGQPVEVRGAGRTDKGVHAAGQVASFALRTAPASTVLRDALNRELPQSVSVLSVETADPRFHARLNASAKVYVYRLWDGEVPNVFERKVLWQCRALTGRIDTEALNRRLRELTGERDFREFSRYTGKKSAVRTLYSAEAERLGDEVRIRFRGSGFLYRQVRMMTGWALTGEKYTAPAHGLCLERVEYGGREAAADPAGESACSK